MRTPWFIVVGGANGSGKSTLAAEGFAKSVIASLGGKLPVEILDLDKIAFELKDQGASSADFRAMAEVKRRVHSSISEKRSISVETVVLATSHLRSMRMAKEAGFGTLQVYVFLRSLTLNLKRVSMRGSMGGHVVAADLIRRRRRLSLERFPAFAEAADLVAVIDNSPDGASSLTDRLFAEKRIDGGWKRYAPLQNAPKQIRRFFSTQRKL